MNGVEEVKNFGFSVGSILMGSLTMVFRRLVAYGPGNILRVFVKKYAQCWYCAFVLCPPSFAEYRLRKFTLSSH